MAETDTEAAARHAWQCEADACFEHDQAHAQRAAERLRQLEQLLPAPRPAQD